MDKNIKDDKGNPTPIKDGDVMNTTTERYCTISESIIESCKQVKLIREGKLPKNHGEILRKNLKQSRTRMTIKCVMI